MNNYDDNFFENIYHAHEHREQLKMDGYKLADPDFCGDAGLPCMVCPDCMETKYTNDLSTPELPKRRIAYFEVF